MEGLLRPADRSLAMSSINVKKKNYRVFHVCEKLNLVMMVWFLLPKQIFDTAPASSCLENMTLISKVVKSDFKMFTSIHRSKLMAMTYSVYKNIWVSCSEFQNQKCSQPFSKFIKHGTNMFFFIKLSSLIL